MIRMRWAHLLFLHWRVPADPLARRIDRALELDTFEGDAYVGLVAFTMPEFRAEGVGGLLGSLSFAEVNVRTYVRHRGGEPAVWFFSLDAGSALAVRGARMLVGLPYHRADAELRAEPDGSVSFRSARRASGAAARLRYAPSGEPWTAEPGTLDHFLTERYLLHARRGDSLLRLRVEHEPYPLRRASASILEESLLAAAGLLRPDQAPVAHYACALDVRGLSPERIG